MKFTILVMLMSTLVVSSIHAQRIQKFSVSLMTEANVYPFTRLGPIHPGLELGVTFWNKKGEFLTHEANAYLGGYHHTKLENGFYTRGEYMPSFNYKNTVGISLPISIGYLRSFYPGTLYEQNSAGEFKKVNQTGVSSLLVNFGIGITYLKINKIQPFIKYESMGVFPLYNGITDIKTFIKIGTNIKLN